MANNEIKDFRSFKMKQGDKMQQEVKLNLSGEALKDLLYLKEKMRVKTLTDVIRKSISLINYVEKERTKGSKLLIMDKYGNYKEIIKLS